MLKLLFYLTIISLLSSLSLSFTAATLSNEEWCSDGFNCNETMIHEHIQATNEALLEKMCPVHCTCSNGTVKCDHHNLTKIPYTVHASIETVKVNVIDMSYNILKVVEENCAHDTRYTVNLANFSHNMIEKIDERAFNENFMTHGLDFSYNAFQTLRANALKPLAKHLFRLDISFNSLGENMSRNEFEELFRNLSALSILHLKHNSIRELFDLSGHQELVYFDLNSNHIKKLKPYFPSSLKLLDLENNQIEVVEESVLRNLKNLTVLRLGHNRIRTIHRDAFKSQEKLKILWMNDNELERIDNLGLFQNLKKLEQLNLANNSLKRIENYAFTMKHHPSLARIQLIDNPDLEYDQLAFCNAFSKTPALMNLTLTISIHSDEDQQKMCFLNALKKRIKIELYVGSRIKKIQCKDTKFAFMNLCKEDGAQEQEAQAAFKLSFQYNRFVGTSSFSDKIKPLRILVSTTLVFIKQILNK